MSRPLRARALLPLTVLVAAACQDYNFNPVGHCMVQPGTERVTLSNLSTADVLFVVDDSGSMAPKQAKLAANFSRFVDNLDATNAARVARGLSPIDFHLAVTTTSVFINGPLGATCQAVSGANVCATSGGTPVLAPKACASDADCSGVSGTTCRQDCTYLIDSTNRRGILGEGFCCGAADPHDAPLAAPIACGAIGEPCGRLPLGHHFDFTGCGGSNTGTAVNGYPYPRGDFVSWNGNPRVLHFDKSLYPAPGTTTGTPTNRQGFTRVDLISAFTGGTFGGSAVNGNVIVGTCGSGQEQGLQAGRLAVQKALSGAQKDTYDLSGHAGWNATTRVASASAEWPHQNSKLVVVFIGDEDDCSSPDDPSGGIVMVTTSQITGGPGNDACTSDTTQQSKKFGIQEFVDYFKSLNRPLGFGFIASAAEEVCGRSLLTGETAVCSGQAPTCTPGVCKQLDCPSAGVCSSGYVSNQFCGGQAAGSRFFELAGQLQSLGDVVEGSVCDSNFGEILNQIAEIVKPPATLTLPTVPAQAEIALLRIADTQGQTRKICKGPAPAGTTPDQAAANYDWWFTQTDKGGDPIAVSRFVFINHATQNCEANPGETYSADYIAQQPAGGCQVTDTTSAAARDAARSYCASKLGGTASSWGCYVPGGATSGVGTCICCAPGSTDPTCM